APRPARGGLPEKKGCVLPLFLAVLIPSAALLVLELDALVGALEIDMQRFAQAVGIIPHPAEDGELDDLLLAEVLLHRREGRLVVARGHVGDRLGPADRRLLPVVEMRARHVVDALRRLDLLFAQADLLA